MSPRRFRSVTLLISLFTLSWASPGRAADAAGDRIKALDAKVEALREEYAATAWPADTPEAIGKLLKHEPGAGAAFIRRALRSEPYPGVLRGARGTLAAGGGNSADLCLLLRDMLAGAAPAPEMRFAIAELTEQEARALVDRAMRSPPARPAAAAPAGPVGAKPAKPPAAATAPPAATRQASIPAARRQLLADLNVAASQIEHALGGALPQPPDAIARAVEQARTHVWLQVRRGNDWLTLDPSAGLPLPTSGVRTVAKLPDDWTHTVTLKMEVERLEGGKLLRESLLEQSWPAAALEGRTVEVMMVPAELSVTKMFDPAAGGPGNFLEQAKGFKRFAVTLSLPEEKSTQGKSFGLDGLATTAVPKAGATGVTTFDPFKRLPGGRGARPGAAQRAAAADLAGVWLTVTIRSPGAQPAIIRRALLDRIGPQARREKRLELAEPWKDATRVAVALFQRHQILFSMGTVGSVRSGKEAVESALLGQPLLRRALEVEQKADAKVLADAMKEVTPPSFRSDLIAVNDASLALTEARLMGRGICFIASPNVYIRSESLDLSPQGVVVSRTGIDVARHELAVLAEPKRLWRTRLLHGLAASELEGRVLDGAGGAATSAARSLRTAAADGGLIAIHSANDLRTVTADPDVKAVMTSELADGLTLLVPAKPSAKGTDAWWRVAPDGNVLAVGSDGRGQAGSEGGMVLTDISIPQVKNCMTFVACFNKGVAGGGAMVQTAATCWAEQVKDVTKEVLDSALDQMVGDPFEKMMAGGDEGDQKPKPEPGTITHLRDAPFQEPEEKSYYELYQEARENLDNLKKQMKQAQDTIQDPMGQLPGVADGRAAADAGAEVGNALGTRIYLLLTMGADIAKFASQPIADRRSGEPPKP
jgi:hypothetical protein